MVSIKEVAKHAGVAISTVSKVLNGYPNISEETKQKVTAAIKELNYIPNSIVLHAGNVYRAITYQILKEQIPFEKLYSIDLKKLFEDFAELTKLF